MPPHPCGLAHAWGSDLNLQNRSAAWNGLEWAGGSRMSPPVYLPSRTLERQYAPPGAAPRAGFVSTPQHDVNQKEGQTGKHSRRPPHSEFGGVFYMPSARIDEIPFATARSCCRYKSEVYTFYILQSRLFIARVVSGEWPRLLGEHLPLEVGSATWHKDASATVFDKACDYPSNYLSVCAMEEWIFVLLADFAGQLSHALLVVPAAKETSDSRKPHRGTPSLAVFTKELKVPALPVGCKVFQAQTVPLGHSDAVIYVPGSRGLLHAQITGDSLVFTVLQPGEIDGRSHWPVTGATALPAGQTKFYVFGGEACLEEGSREAGGLESPKAPGAPGLTLVKIFREGFTCTHCGLAPSLPLRWASLCHLDANNIAIFGGAGGDGRNLLYCYNAVDVRSSVQEVTEDSLTEKRWLQPSSPVPPPGEDQPHDDSFYTEGKRLDYSRPGAGGFMYCHDTGEQAGARELRLINVSYHDCALLAVGVGTPRAPAAERPRSSGGQGRADPEIQ